MLECSSATKNRQSLWRSASWLLIKDVLKELLRVQEGIKGGKEVEQPSLTTWANTSQVKVGSLFFSIVIFAEV